MGDKHISAPGDMEALARAITTILEDSNLKEKLGNKAHRYADLHS